MACRPAAGRTPHAGACRGRPPPPIPPPLVPHLLGHEVVDAVALALEQLKGPDLLQLLEHGAQVAEAALRHRWGRGAGRGVEAAEARHAGGRGRAPPQRLPGPAPTLQRRPPGAAHLRLLPVLRVRLPLEQRLWRVGKVLGEGEQVCGSEGGGGGGGSRQVAAAWRVAQRLLGQHVQMGPPRGTLCKLHTPTTRPASLPPHRPTASPLTHSAVLAAAHCAANFSHRASTCSSQKWPAVSHV